MSRRQRILLIVALLVPVVYLGIRVRVELPEISFIPEVLFSIDLAGFTYPVSNTLISTIIVSFLLVVVAFLTTRRMALVPGSVQNAAEALIEVIYNQIVEVAGEDRARKFFPVVASIFLFVLLSNWLGLVPGFGTIGVEEVHEVEGHAEEVLVPLFRAPSTDLNMTLGLALVSVTLAQVFGMQALGVFGYWGKFINIRRLLRLANPGPDERPGTLLFNGILDLIVGVIELVSEFSKIIAFTFRLFGNIFAGEVLLLIMAFFFPFLLPLVFFLFETFVGFIQAFIFAILTLFFMTLATTAHGEAVSP
ncbi:MAG: F0F1 ATP synthase subunit A [Anaerolineae bacterium]